MAKKRMFSLQIVDTDAFLDMPISSQALYFHLSMRADDDGFISNPKKIMKMVGCQDNDLSILLTKRFILGFENGIIVIKHWRINNYIRKDRYEKTAYLEEKKTLKLKENGIYTENGQPDVNQITTSGTPSIDKIRLGKILQSNDCEVFNNNSYIKEMIENKQPHISLIGKYFKQRDLTFPNKETIQEETKRWLKDAKYLSAFNQKEIDQVFNYVINKFPDHWVLSTMRKYISDPIIWK